MNYSEMGKTDKNEGETVQVVAGVSGWEWNSRVVEYVIGLTID